RSASPWANFRFAEILDNRYLAQGEVERNPGNSIGAFIVDDVIVHIYRAPRSFTGEDLCEITSHGSPVIAQEILSLLVLQGARQAEPGEFSRRAFFNGKIGIEEAELIAIKADAKSEAELHGAELALHEKFERLRHAYEGLISLIAQIDAEIDFGESDHIDIDNFGERVNAVIDVLNQLIRESANRRENAGYFTIALTGPPNVGKSSVFNALLNYERSIVSDTPGTTRDYVEAFISVDGFRVKLIDTAGLREASESIEHRGIELGQSASRHSDFTLRVTSPDDRKPDEVGALLLHNKIDLDAWASGLRMSAKTGEGMESVHRWLSEKLHERSSEFSQIALSDSERRTLESIVNALSNVDPNLEPPILSEELRNAAASIGELLGMNISADSLDYIFSKMCIGK
ncbi:MAG TPA: tRNA uridine-5-carboxymethylaminomethyl(34) synthesis GTPase MnmE, partial [Candidatus Kapabacteria bacterium]|nr:tRNA uridine-5-carboxymethylaminomethyl(34) synthesis GTPase MnmE [Candidatus Kapabacteria bacterium]